MYYEIIESLHNVGYNGQMLQESEFVESLQKGFVCEKFRNLIINLTNLIATLGKLDDKITTQCDADTFMIELSGFLKELGCSYDILVSDQVNNRMQSVPSRYLLLEYLIGELMSLKMVFENKPKTNNIITLQETSHASALKDIALTLNLGKPPDTVLPKALFEKINGRLYEMSKIIPDYEKRIGEPLFKPKQNISDNQWNQIEETCKSLDDEYNLRRKMLTTRLDVTIKSFQWADEKKRGVEKDITEKYASKRALIEILELGGKNADLSALLAAREQLAVIEKTSSANVRKNTQSKIQRLIIGSVPDRGGRANEHSIPAPEMPSWLAKRSAEGRGGGNFQKAQRGRGSQQNRDGNNQRSHQQHYNYDNHGRGRSNRVQGSWPQQQQYNNNVSEQGYPGQSRRDGYDFDNQQNNSGRR